MANNTITETLRFKFNTIARDQSDATFLDWRDLDLGTRADSNMQKLDAELYKILKRGLFIANTTTPSANQYVVSNSAIVEMFDKMALLLIPNADNTNTTTLQINSFVSSPIKKVSNNTYIDIVAGDLKSKQPTLIYYDLNSNVFVLASALVQSASTTQSGIVQLSNDTNSTDETKAVTPKALKTVADAKLDANQKGVANGVASLGSDGKVSLTQIPDAILGSLKYIDTWDASGGTTPSNPSDGNYWIISNAGIIDDITYTVKDWLIYNNSTWSKLDGDDISFEHSTSNIKMNGTASVGDSGKIAHSNHVHPSDSTKANASELGDISTLTTEDKTSAVNAINETSNKIGILSTKIDSGVTQTPTVNLGMNSVIRKTDNGLSFLKYVIQGKSYVNLLGKDGNCEDLSKWLNFQSTTTLDTTNKVFGSNGFKIAVAASTLGASFKILNTTTIDATKYYMASAYLKNGNASSVQLIKDITGGGSTVSSVFVTDTTKFTRICIKLSPSSINTGNSFGVFVSGAIGQYAYVDGIMLNEITADEYNNLTVDQLLEKYPYVDSYACLQNPYIEVRHDNLIRNGNGEEGIGWWTPKGTAVPLQIEGGRFKIASLAQYTGYTQAMKVKPNANYYTKGNVTNFSVSVWTSNNGVIGSWLASLGSTFNSGANTEIIILVQNEQATATTGYFDSIHLIEGTTAPTSYKPCRIERCVIEGKFTSDDSFTYENGEVSGLLNWKHKTLFGKDIDGWTLGADLTGVKRYYVPSYFGGLKKLGVDTGVITKYDGKILTQAQANADITTGDMFHNINNDLLLSFFDTDTGWAESINPNADEAKAFMNGWRATANNGTRYTAWVSVVDGTTVPTSQTIDYVKANVAQNYIGYELHYRLQNPEPITDVNTRVIGDIPKLDVGDNYLYLDYGMVLGEVANPQTNGTNYYINNTASDVKLSILKSKVSTISNVYSNGINASVWSHTSDRFTYGDDRVFTPVANFDTNATYTVDYQILKTMHTSPTSIEVAYNQDILSAVSDLAESVNGKQNHDSALDDYVSNSTYEEVSVYLAGRFCNITSTNVQLECIVSFIKKDVLPIANIVPTVVYYLNGTTLVEIPSSDIIFCAIPISKTAMRFIISYKGTDSTIRTALLNNGGGTTYAVKIVLDCRGRI